MNAADKWLESAEGVYGGQDDARTFDRAARVRGEVDLLMYIRALVHEARKIRVLLETEPQKAKALGAKLGMQK